MQRFLIHGENTIASRQHLLDLLAPYKAKNIPLQFVVGKKLTPAQAELLVGESSLFTELTTTENSDSGAVSIDPEKILVIEELHSLPLGKKRTALIETLIAAPASTLLIFWEKKKLTALMIKKLELPSPKSAQLFEPSSAVWKFLDAFAPANHNSTAKSHLLQLYKKSLETEDPFYLQALLNRQVRLLIQIKTGPQPRLAPFQVSKYNAQAKLFTLNQLLALHHQLLDLEYRLKTSGLNFDLSQEIFLFLTNL